MNKLNACNFSGNVIKDQAASNVDVGQRLRTDRLSVCTSADITNIEANTIVTNNLTVLNQLNICVNKSLRFDAAGCLGYGIDYGNTVFVATTGNNATGMRERIDCPFATPWDAVNASNNNVNAAQPGDTVIVLPGTYIMSGNDNPADPARLVKNGISVFCFPGVSIQFTATGGAAPQPFSDLGSTMVAQFRGYAQVISNYSADRNRILTQPGSSLILEGDEFIHAVRFFNSNGSLYHFKARRDEISNVNNHGHILAHRQPLNTIIDLKYEVDEAIVESQLGGIGWSQYDFRGFNENSKLDVWIGRLTMTDTSRVGVIHMETMIGQNKLHIDNLVQRGTPTVNFNKSILYLNVTGGEYDIRIRGINNADGQGFRGNPIISYTNGATLSSGTIEMEGRLSMIVDGIIDPTNGLNFAPGSQVTLLLQMEVDAVVGVNRAFLDVSSCPNTIVVSGRVRYTGAGDSLQAPFQLNNNSASSASFKDLTIQVINLAPPFVTATIGAAVPVNFMNVWCNVNVPVAVVTDTLLAGTTTSSGGAVLSGSWFTNASVVT